MLRDDAPVSTCVSTLSSDRHSAVADRAGGATGREGRGRAMQVDPNLGRLISVA